MEIRPIAAGCTSWTAGNVTATQATQVSPHRADLRFEAGGHTPHHVSSAKTSGWPGGTDNFVVEANQREVVLLVDDPAAELDCEHRERLFELFKTVPAQMFVAALDLDELPWRTTGKRFHVEHGELAPLI